MGPWVALPYQGNIAQNERILSAKLEIATDHPFSDDLMIGIQDSRTQLHEIFKGEEELDIPNTLELGPIDSAGEILIRDIGPKLTGSVLKARLILRLAEVSCR